MKTRLGYQLVIRKLAEPQPCSTAGYESYFTAMKALMSFAEKHIKAGEATLAPAADKDTWLLLVKDQSEKSSYLSYLLGIEPYLL